MKRRWTILAFAAVPALAGCWVLVGESFTGYSDTSPDASRDSAVDASGDSDAGDSATGNCAPACTGANTTCDPADDKCKLDGKTSKVGAPCVIESDADTMCGTAPNHKCKESGNDGFPGGYCTITPCDDIALCPIGATCAHLTGESEVACYKTCASNADCRTPDYSCFELGTLYRSGAGTKVCHPNAFGCYVAADCPPAKPKCGADPEAGTVGFCTP